MGKLRVQVVVRSLGPLDTPSTLTVDVDDGVSEACMDDDGAGWC